MSLNQKYEPVYYFGELLFFKNFPCIKKHCSVEKNEFNKRYPNKAKYQLIVLPNWMYEKFYLRANTGPFAIHLSHLAVDLQNKIISEKTIPNEPLKFWWIKGESQRNKQKKFVIDTKTIDESLIKDLQCLITAQQTQEQFTLFSSDEQNNTKMSSSLSGQTTSCELQQTSMYDPLNDDFLTIQQSFQSTSNWDSSFVVSAKDNPLPVVDLSNLTSVNNVSARVVTPETISLPTATAESSAELLLDTNVETGSTTDVCTNLINFNVHVERESSYCHPTRVGGFSQLPNEPSCSDSTSNEYGNSFT